MLISRRVLSSAATLKLKLSATALSTSALVYASVIPYPLNVVGVPVSDPNAPSKPVMVMSPSALLAVVIPVPPSIRKLSPSLIFLIVESSAPTPMFVKAVPLPPLIVKLPEPSRLSPFIVLMFVPLTNASCASVIP